MYSLPFRDIAVAEITQNMDIMTEIPGGSKDGNCDRQFPFQEAEYGAIGDKPGPKAGGFSHAKAGNDGNEGNAKHEDRAR